MYLFELVKNKLIVLLPIREEISCVNSLSLYVFQEMKQFWCSLSLKVNNGSNFIFELLNQVDQLARTAGRVVVAFMLTDRIANLVVPENNVSLKTN